MNYSSNSPAYRVYDYEKNKVYDVAAPQFDEEVDPGWWRVSEQEEEEFLSFPTYVPPPAASSATISEVIDPNPLLGPLPIVTSASLVGVPNPY